MRNRAYRRHQRARIRARHLEYYNLFVAPLDLWMNRSPMPAPRNIAVRHPADCGGRCYLCHGDKLLEPRRARERRIWKREAEQELRDRALAGHRVRPHTGRTVIEAS